MIGKDWLSDAAEEISRVISNTQSPGPWFRSRVQAQAHVRAILTKHCPFKEDVAYEPVALEKVDSTRVK